ncbi:MAG: glycosyltransferase, partial [Verrucomicrobiota bacterium]
AVFNFLDYLTGFMETWPAVFTRTGFVPALTRFELGLPRRYAAEGILTVSQPLAEYFAATGYPADRILPLQYGYDATRFQPPAEAVEAGPPVVVMHGSFDRHHLGRIAAAALAGVHLVRPEVVFRFVGRETPGLLAFVEEVRRRQPGIQVQLTGFIPYPEVGAQLRNATLGIVPYEESRGTHCAFVAKAVEYLGCGLPVASTPLENLRGYFGDEPAIRFSSFTGAGLARVILDWLEMPAARRRELGRRAAARVARDLDWPVIAGRAVDFVERIAAAAGPVPGRKGRS